MMTALMMIDFMMSNKDSALARGGGPTATGFCNKEIIDITGRKIGYLCIPLEQQVEIPF